MWSIEGYGEVPSENRIWLSLEKIEVYRRNVGHLELQKEDMKVGEGGVAFFRSSGKIQANIVRTA